MTRRRILAITLAAALAVAGGAAVWLIADDDEGRRAGALTSETSCPADPIVIDLKGDGIDLSGKTTTSLFGCAQTIRWTPVSPTDAFVVIDADGAKADGYSIRYASGKPAMGTQLVRGGFEVVRPDGSSTIAKDGWEMLGVLDSDEDGALTPDDNGASRLSLFTDTDADGAIGAKELAPLVNTAESISLQHGSELTDRYGSRFTQGTWVNHNGVSLSIIAILIGL